MIDRMKLRASLYGLVAAGALMAFAPGIAAAQDENEVLARVGGAEITAREVELAEQDLGNALGALPEAERRDYLVTFLIDLKLLAQAAEAQGVADGEGFEARLTYLRDKALMEEFLNTEIEREVDDEAIAAFYQEQVAGAETEEEVRARHILVETEEEAQAVAEELEGGADFAELAEARTQDPSGKENGGDLGYFTRERMVPEFAEVAFTTEPGEVSEPVETQFGWHVIKVEDKREREAPALEEVEDRVRAYLVRQAQADLITRLREEADIEKLGAAAEDAGDEAETEAPAADPAAPAAPAAPSDTAPQEAPQPAQ